MSFKRGSKSDKDGNAVAELVKMIQDIA